MADELAHLLYFPVRIELDDGSNSKIRKFTSGNMFTVDPVSTNIILAKFGNSEDKNSISNFEVIPGCSIAKVEELKEIDENTKSYSEDVKTLFDNFFSETKDSNDSEETIQKRGRKVIDYLKSHHIDVVEKSDGVFEICGVVKFERPYSRDCFYCDIPIVLQRILKLIDQIE